MAYVISAHWSLFCVSCRKGVCVRMQNVLKRVHFILKRVKQALKNLYFYFRAVRACVKRVHTFILKKSKLS